MNMKRITILLLAAVFLLVFAGTATAQTTETDIFGIEIGQFTGYDLDNEEIGVGQLLGLHFGLTEAMELGFVFLDYSDNAAPLPNTHDFGLVRMTYFLQDEFGFQLSSGTSGGGMVAGGLGVFTSPIRREFNDTLTTSLRLALDYLVPDMTTGVNEGIVGVTVSGKIAF